MLLALLDYFYYRRGKGIYSHAALERQGGKVAAPGLAPLLEVCKPGDHLLHHTSNSIQSWLVMYFTASPWSHVTVLAKGGQLYDMTTDGFRIHHFSDYLDGNGYILVLHPKQPFNAVS